MNRKIPYRNKSIQCIYTCFQYYVHSGHLSTSFDKHLSTSSLDVLFEISQSQPMHGDVCFMSLLCKWATSSKSHVSGLWLVDFDPSCFLSMSKDGWRKISVMHVTLKAGISEVFQTTEQRLSRSACPKWTLFHLNIFNFQTDCFETPPPPAVSGSFEVILKQLPTFLRPHQVPFTQNNLYR